MQKVKILPNRQKPWAIELAREVRQFLTVHGFKITNKNAHASICIGGDGTIYHMNYRHRLEGKIIGIGTETSHVCKCTRKNWKQKLLPLLHTKAKERITLQTKAKNQQLTAIADVVIHTHNYRIIKIFGKITGSKQFNFEGDGIIIATPTGSPAYAYSAGGPIIADEKKLMLVVPICPYKRAFKPMVLPTNSSITIWTDRTSDLIIDGILIARLQHGDKITVKLGKKMMFA